MEAENRPSFHQLNQRITNHIIYEIPSPPLKINPISAINSGLIPRWVKPKTIQFVFVVSLLYTPLRIQIANNCVCWSITNKYHHLMKNKLVFAMI
jgi:hypothetical protein